MPFSVEFIRKLEKTPPELREVLLALLEEVERQREESVTKKEFQEFVRHTDDNFQKVWQAIRELAEAQRKTEQRLNELAEAQKKTEQELQEFKKATEEEFKKVWASIEELTKAQKKTEEELRKLTGEVRHLKDTVAGLSDTVGYGLEDQIFPYMEDFVRKEYGVEVEVLDRRNVIYPDGRFDEVNIYVEGKRDGKRVYIVGECKSKPGKKDIRRFSEMLRRLRGHFGEDVEGFMVGYYFHPEVEEYLKQRYPEIKVFKSFEFRLRYKASVVV